VESGISFGLGDRGGADGVRLPGDAHEVVAGRDREVGRRLQIEVENLELVFFQWDRVRVRISIKAARIGRDVAAAGFVRGGVFVGEREATTKAGGDRCRGVEVLDEDAKADRLALFVGGGRDAKSEAEAVPLVRLDELLVSDVGCVGLRWFCCRGTIGYGGRCGGMLAGGEREGQETSENKALLYVHDGEMRVTGGEVSFQSGNLPG
jgi:hypothetical protein